MSIDAFPPSAATLELQSAIARLTSGVRDLAAARKACERMDRMREELRERIGTVDVAVDLVREFRDR